MPEYLIERLNEMWAVKGSAQSSSFSFVVVDPNTSERQLITFETELLG